jgi:hypothetical protein
MIRHAWGLVGYVIASLLSASLVAFVGQPTRSVVLCDAPVSPAHAASSALVDSRERPKRRAARELPRITFEGKLVAFTPTGYGPCGIFAFYQRARYRITRVLEGDCHAFEVVVDHLACEANVFEGLKVGDAVRVTVEVDVRHNGGLGPSTDKDDQLVPAVVLVAVHAPTRLDTEIQGKPPN